jgi:CheY-like chemotaxis protein
MFDNGWVKVYYTENGRKQNMAKILVIEDNPEVSELLCLILEKEGHLVSKAMSAEEGIEQINANPPDLITLDIHMPGKGGLAVANELHRKKLHIPFILCTASVLDDPVEAYELFMVRHLYAGTLKKPLEMQAIPRLVSRALEMKKQLELETRLE